MVGVCTPSMEFIYVLPGCEGSAHDGRVLRDAISRTNGLRVPQGRYQYFVSLFAQIPFIDTNFGYMCV